MSERDPGSTRELAVIWAVAPNPRPPCASSRDPLPSDPLPRRPFPSRCPRSGSGRTNRRGAEAAEAGGEEAGEEKDWDRDLRRSRASTGPALSLLPRLFRPRRPRRLGGSSLWIWIRIGQRKVEPGRPEWLSA